MTRPVFIAALLSLSACLAACGGGEPEERTQLPSATTAVITVDAVPMAEQAQVRAVDNQIARDKAREAMIRPTIELAGYGQHGYPQVKLTFGEDSFGIPVAVGDVIVWHSGMIYADQPTAPRGIVERDPEGPLTVVIPHYYTTDRGLFAAVPKGRTVVMGNRGEPVGAMNVAHWKLPNLWQPVDVGYDRIWIDVHFQQ